MGDRLGILGAVGLIFFSFYFFVGGGGVIYSFLFFSLQISNPRNISKETTVEEMFLRRDVEVSKFI